ncbi:polyketide synthase [Mycobacterium intermedium]|uniref:Polyketide synthase n=1 Tax=Mycobacterium intermedium TaxID=28445 RepID=A0A1E3S5F1_MYCIE|nr:polyketide synthase Pks13 [Mycobacterium intermedium]MCV6964597.1 type I polyketide synthase [Mycobacterium intermedium]ODQ97386.1 polyketide synthase [Mycobacterium intermedium]OPE46853.1 polyketide synthase [Mycobacterium intermedium]ORA96380.1 polyketide synthase [Mycobacterium intermedium]
MADTENQPQENAPAGQPAKGPDMTVPEMRQWLREWVGKAVGRSPDDIDESVPMVELGLSSRDAVAMAADIEDLTGVTLSVAVAFQHPTIESLATRIIEGEPEQTEDEADAIDWSRSGPAERVDIAIVGLSTRLPGDMNSPDETWQALLEGRDAITDLPEGRWAEFLEEPRLAERIGKARTRGGYLKDIKGFDSEFFAVAKTEADNIDPQQRMALELTWEALEHARIPASSLRGEAVGVFIGVTNNDYGFLAISDPTVAHPYAITGNSGAIIPNRVSYFYDFRGPSVMVDTACSSSLVAIHQGVQALRNGEADVVLAGGVNALITPAVTLGFDEIGAVLAPDGRIKSFSADADGYTRSEGGGMVVLKRVDDARRDGDQILAVIAGSAVNHDGRSNGLIAPNQDAQAEVLRRAYKDAGIDPRNVDYIEAHGTGTILGDPIEAEALGRVVGRNRPADRPALLGAIKTNIGHLESAAGVASIAKVALALHHGKLPPSINFTAPSPYIDFDAMRLKVLDHVADWPRYGGYALAGVSSFGFGGANAHIVLREVLPRDVIEREPEPEATPAQPAVTSAGGDIAEGEGHALRFDEYGEIITDERVGAGGADEEYELPGVTEEALRLKALALEELAAQEPSPPLIPLVVSAFLTSRKKAAAAELADWMESPEGQASSLESIGRSLSRRNHGRSRAVVLAHDHEEAIKGLRAVAEGKQRPNVFSVDGPVTNGPVWAMAGFGAQHRKMAKSLYLRNEVFAEWIEKVDSLIQDERGYSVLELILDDSHEYGIETSNVTIFAIQIALGELLKHHGAKPAAVVGQSLGEPASAYFAGGLSLEDATRVICSRSHLMGEGEAMLFGEYIRFMAIVEYSADELKTVFSDYPDLEVCVYAAPSQTVIGGPPEQIDAIIARAESEGKFARKLQTKGAGHTSQMDPLLGEFSAELQGIKPMSPTVGIFSTVHEGTYIKPGSEPIHDVAYWIKGMRHSVYFTHGIRNAVDSGFTTFLELAPNPVALMQIGLTTAAAGLHDAQLIATLARKQDEVESMITAMAQLYVYGHDLDIRTLFTRAKGPEDYANIPPTRFKRKEHWLDVHFTGDTAVLMPGNHVALPDGRHVWEYAPREKTDLAALVRSAATTVLPDAVITAAEQRAVPGLGARLVTTLTRHPGGASVQVHARIDESFTLVYDALVSRGGVESVLPAAVGAGTAVAVSAAEPAGDVAAIGAGTEDDDAETLSDSLTTRYMPAGFTKWSPESGETIAERLGTIVGAAMGYEPEDLPWEVPLIELGLDSLMAVRIKNRVEYDFDLPPIQLTAVRDANLYAVEKLIEYAIEHRDEVQQLHEYQKTQTAEEIAKAQAELLSGATPSTVLAPAPDPQAEPQTRPEPAAAPEAASEAAPEASDAPIPPPPTDPSGPAGAGTNGTAAAGNGQAVDLKGAAAALSQEAVAKALNSDVPPRDQAERVTFATWAIVTGKSPGGIFNPLPKLDEASAKKMAERLSERAEGPITVEDVVSSANIEELADKVRGYLEAGVLDGFVRTLRPRREGDPTPPVFVFHPAGGSTVVYEPLLNRLPPDTPMYGFERVEGTIEERAEIYVPKLIEMQGDGPYILVGWSLGGVLAYACAIGLKRLGKDVRFVGLIDAVRAGEEIPQTKEEIRKRWDRYAKFAEKTFNVTIPAIPYEHLEQLDDEGQVRFVLDAVKESGVQIPAGIIEHQRTSYLDNRAIDTAQIQPFDGHVTLYMADRYHDDAIMFEPRYAVRKPDGGWGEYVSDLEVVPIGGEHIQAIDEPIIAKVGEHMSRALKEIQSRTS